MTACWKLGIDDVTAGEMGVPLSDVPIVRSYPSYIYIFLEKESLLEAALKTDFAENIRTNI
jgi:hypothetical protein